MCQLIVSCCVLHNLCINADDFLDEEQGEVTQWEEVAYQDTGDEVDSALYTLGEKKRQKLVHMMKQ